VGGRAVGRCGRAVVDVPSAVLAAVVDVPSAVVAAVVDVPSAVLAAVGAGAAVALLWWSGALPGPSAAAVRRCPSA